MATVDGEGEGGGGVGGGGARRKVAVVVDDDFDTQRLMVRAIERFGVEARAFGDGESAIAWLEANPAPDAIIIDILLPHMTGFELGRRIRAHPRLALVPLLVTTARDDMQDEALALELRAMFLAKPFRMRDYLSSIGRMLDPDALRKKPAFVMVVDDDVEILKALVAIFRDEGYETMVAMTGIEALARLRHGPRPDVVVLDLMMPDMDGLELADRLRHDPGLSSLPLLLFSANDRIASHATNVGALTHVKKPVDLDVLLDVVDRAIRLNDVVACSP
jgi:CheY-like chemotaxis protein